MKTGKIYVVTNLVNGKYYVGKTMRDDPNKRFSEHKKGNKATLLSQAIAKHGASQFNFSVVAETADLDNLNDLEILWISVLAANQRGIGYNRTEGGYIIPAATRKAQADTVRGRTPWNKGLKGVLKGWNKGLKMSPESRSKMSESKKGKKQSPDLVRKRMESKLGYRHSAESRKKMSDIAKAKNHRPCQAAIEASAVLRRGNPSWNSGTKGAQVAWNKGIPMTEEMKKRQSEIRKGIPMSMETREKISASMKGKMPPVNQRRIDADRLIAGGK